MKVKVRKILLCVFLALFIVTLFTASFSLGRYSSVQSSESDYDDDFEYTLYDSIVVNTIDEFFAAISNGYNYIIIGDAIKDPLIIAGSMSDIRDDLIIDLNGHEIQRNSRDPLLNVTTGFTLTIIDRVGTGSMYNPVGSVIQVSGGTLTVQNGIFESGPRSDNSRDAKRDNTVNVNHFNEYVQGTHDTGELYSTPGGGSISGTAQVTVYGNQNIGSSNSDSEYTNRYENVTMPIITPKTTGRGVVNGSMYFDSGTWDTNEVPPWYPYITNDTYLYYTYEAENMQFSNTADKSTANYYYQYEDENLDTITVYVYNDVKGYANNGYYPVDSSSDNTGFAAVKMQEGNLYVRGGTYYSYFGEENTFGVQSTGGLMSVNPTGTNAINFYAYQNGVCVECTVDKPTENEMLNISNGSFYSELGDTVRVKNGNLVIGTADFTKDVGSYSGETTTTWGRNGSVIDISGGTLTINNSATFTITGSYINGIYSHGGTNSSVRVTNAEFTFSGTTDLVYNCGILAAAGSVTCYGETTIDLSNGDNHNIGIYSAGGTIELGQSRENVTTLQTTINVAINGQSSNNYGIYSEGGSISGYGTTQITLGNLNSATTNSQGIYSEGGEIHLGQTQNETAGQTTIQVNGDKEVSNNVVASHNNFGIHAIGGEINTYGTTTVTVYGTDSTGVYATVPDTTSTSSINISGSQFKCYVYDMPQTLPDGYTHTISSTAVSTEGGQINFNVANADITSDGFGITASNTIYVNNTSQEVNADNAGRVQLTAPENTTTTPTVGLTSRNGTAIYIYDGKLLVNSGITLNVNSTIRPYGWASRNNNVSTTNGIYIVGGSFTSHGAVNITNEVTGTWQYGENRDDNMFSAGGIANTDVSNFNGIFIDGGSFESSDAENSTAKASLGLNNSISADYQKWKDRHYDSENWEWVDAGYYSVDTWYSFDNSSYSGIYVHGSSNGGSFTATGTGQITVGEGDNAVKTTGLYVSHQGVENDDVRVAGGDNAKIDSGYEYRDFKIKSFAVRVESLPDSLIGTTVAINKANIQSIIKEENGKIIGGGGGGLYVSGGNVTLGNENSQQGDISITTQGTSYYSGEYTVAGHANSNWKAPVPKTGGHAVQVNGGELTIYNGTYQSALGNGILVSNGEATIQYGSFIGADPVVQNNKRMDVAGAAANYGFKMYGGEVVINDGTFGGNGSGAFVMGTGTDSNTAKANIYGGSFDVTGQAGFSVYQYANVIFGNDSNDIINAKGDAAGLVIETTPNGDAPTVTINAGTFESIRNSNGDGVWYGNGSAKLTITGGKFIGSSRAGLYFEVAPEGKNVQLSGGTYTGSVNHIEGYTDWGSSYVRNIGCSKNAIDGEIKFNYDRLLSGNSVATLGFKDDDIKLLSYNGRNITYSSQLTISVQNAGGTSIGDSGTATIHRRVDTYSCGYYYNHIVISLL